MENISYRGWILPSQAKTASPNETWRLPLLDRLIDAANLVEKRTKYKWKATSYERFSPSHKMLYALDIAPDIAPSAEKFYAVNNGSDPVLYHRKPLLRALSKAVQDFDAVETARVRAIGGRRLIVCYFVESDHIHIHLLWPSAQFPTSRVVAWRLPKPIYGDTNSRVQLPMTESGYL